MYNKGFINSFNTLMGPTLLHIIFPLPILKKYGKIKIILEIIENNPNFNKIPFPNAFDIYRYHVKRNEIEQIKVFEDSLESTEPNNFIELSKKYYLDKNIK